MAVSPDLLDAIKNYLDITWPDPAGDVKLIGIIARGMRYLERVAGGTLDFEAEDVPRALLLDYCRYVRSNALDEFEVNYQSELLSMQIWKEVGGLDQEEDAGDQ